MPGRLVVALGTCSAVAALLGTAPAAAPFVPRAVAGHLTVTEEDPDPTPAGGQTLLHATAENGGPGEAGAFTLTLQLPDGVVAQGPFFPRSCTVTPDGHTVTCPFPAGLPFEQTASASMQMQVDPGVAPGTLTGTLTVSSDDDPDPTGHTTPFVIQVTG
ncbi:hypothetical protein [Kitasatospora sp. LaBMicrA B282]|uniref:hypothetical protein n=1 Tax=Kitasatospora sp. LaBMicrA B282 TaxID=3420949 RepID=UPI003D0DB1A5